MRNRKIIVEILTKYSKNLPLSNEELEELVNWKNLSSENEKLIEELGDENKKLAYLNILSTVDIEQDWKKIKLRIEPSISETEPRKPLFKRMIPYAAAVAAALCIFTYVSQKNNTGPTNTIVQATINQKENTSPAQIGAKLILTNGSQLTLNNHELNRNEDGLILSSDGNQLQIDVNPEEEIIQTANNTLIVPKGSYYNIILSDNTKVWVNANSKLSFPNRFSKTERRVRIEGEAYFEVSHDSNRPFIVESENTETKVLGTKFNINAYTSQVKTTLVSGKVELNAQGEKAILSPGQSAKWDGQQLLVQKANLAKDLAWKNAEFEFENDHIIHIAQELSRWYGIEVKLSQDINTKKIYSGNISRNSDLENVIKVLNFGSDFKFELLNNKLIIQNK